MRTHYTCKTKGGTAKITQGPRLWNLYLGGQHLGSYQSPEAAALALAGGNARFPAGVNPGLWQAPGVLSGWERSEHENPPDEQAGGGTSR